MANNTRFPLVGNWSFVGEGKILDTKTGEEFNAKLKFKATNVEIESNTVENIKSVKINNSVIADEFGTMWELGILDEK